ncbi:MAG TPA: metal ABC transporter permease, partial [Candidatus Gracilibacteria bacterium]|nr:metal ABC transporter permease [Candidatus Gracilibacteria bacterium]
MLNDYLFLLPSFSAGLALSMVCALLGTFLVINRFSLLGDGIAHLSFSSIALALVLGLPPLYLAIPLALLASLGIDYLEKSKSLGGDASIGILSSGGMALGLILISVYQSSSLSIQNYLFGNILLINSAEMWITILWSLIVSSLIIYFHSPLLIISLNSDLAHTNGYKTSFWRIFLLFISSVSIVLSIKLVGVILASALFILPISIAIQYRKNFQKTRILSLISGFSMIISGFLLSILLNWPTG